MEGKVEMFAYDPEYIPTKYDNRFKGFSSNDLTIYKVKNILETFKLKMSFGRKKITNDATNGENIWDIFHKD